MDGYPHHIFRQRPVRPDADPVSLRVERAMLSADAQRRAALSGRAAKGDDAADPLLGVVGRRPLLPVL